MRTREALYPLGKFSEFVVRDLPRFNQHASSDVAEFFNKGNTLLPDSSAIIEVAEESEDAGASALGDLGMFAATLNRRGLPVAFSPRLLEHLLLLARKTGLPPRDNYYSYTERNSPGAYARTYTGHSEEHLMVFYNEHFSALFGSVARTLISLVHADGWQSVALDTKVQEAANNLSETKDLMLAVRQSVSPEVFSASRKFTVPIDIPGAIWRDDEGQPTTAVTNIDADSNIALIDLLLYGHDDLHLAYLQQLYPYFPVSRKQVFEELVIGDFPSIEDRLMDERGELLFSTQKAFVEIFKQMWGWRVMHNSAVTTHLRTKAKGQNPDGSGFEYDQKLRRLLNRSKNGYQRVVALAE